MKFYVQETSPGIFTELVPGQGIRHEDVLHPWQVTELWSANELAQIGVYEVNVTVPEGHTYLGYEVTRDETGVKTTIKTQANPAPQTPPLAVSPRQIRLALNQLGLRQAVEDYVAQADITVKDSWEYSTQFERNHPLLVAAGQALGKSDAEIDQLFQLALTL